MPIKSAAQDAACAEIRAPIDPDHPPATRIALHRFVRDVLKADIALTPLLDPVHSDAPMDYLYHAFFEGLIPKADQPAGTPREPASLRPSDCVVWANRGGGKTFLGAVATALDLVFKPGIEIRILGGSLEQSRRMYEHLRRLFELPLLADLVDGKPSVRGLRLTSGARAEILAQSESSVRGTRVQKLRCDEVELFDRELWNAAQLTTRSLRLSGPWGNWVRGSIEALSTMHKPYGLMWEVVGSASRGAPRTPPSPLSSSGDKGEGGGEGSSAFASASAVSSRTHPSPRRLFRWGVVDVLEPCTDEHACNTCTLHPDCAGRAKQRPEGQGGHVSIADAIAMKSRVDEQAWQAEMLCLRPSRGACVYPEFNTSRHVVTDGHAYPGVDARPVDPLNPLPRRADHTELVCGMDYGYRADTVILIARVDPDESGAIGPGRAVITILDELVARETTLAEHIVRLRASPWVRAWGDPVWIGADPAGEQRSGQTGRSSADMLRAAGFRLRDRRCGFYEGLSMVRRRLAPADGSPPRLRVHTRCAGLIESLERYHFPEDKPESLEPVKDGMDHAADALRYLVVGLDYAAKAKMTRWA